MKFLDVKTDFAFKKVFGSEQSAGLLRSFLNAILYSGSAQQISSLKIVDPYTVPKLLGMKDTFVDVKAVLNDGSQVIIEMQVLNHAGFEQRVLYNAAKNYSQQLKKGNDYTLLNPVVALTIVDFTLFEPVPAELKPQPYLSRFKLMDIQSLTQYSGDIELVFIELPKFTTTEHALQAAQTPQSPQEQWIYFIKHAGNLDAIPPALGASNDFKQAFNIINEAGMTDEELEAQYKRQEFIVINRSISERAKRTELAEKAAEAALARGMALRSLEIARSLLDVLDDTTIALKTQLPVATVAALRR
jgi:predicted transposase/invertase (TIGR01784 family)